MKMENKIRVAVYGSLRKNMYNHEHYLGKSKLLGTFETEPIYNLYDLGSYPGLKKEGDTSITIEVYEVDLTTLQRINNLEGYNPSSSKNDFYDRELIETPYGDAFLYFYVPNIEESKKIEHGNWVAHCEIKKKDLAFI